MFGIVAFSEGEREQWNNGVRNCVSRGDNGLMGQYIHHLVRAVFVLGWISYQRNCVCRLHQCERAAPCVRCVCVSMLIETVRCARGRGQAVSRTPDAKC